MLRWAIIFFIIAIVALLLGFTSVGAIAQYAAVACLVVAVIFFILNMVRKV